MGLNNPPEGSLRVRSHGVGLVKDDELEWRARVVFEVSLGRLGHSQISKRLDLVPNHGNPSLIGSVHFENATAEEIRPPHVPAQCQGHRRLARSWGSVKEQVRKVARLHSLRKGIPSLRLVLDIRETLGSILLDP